MGLAAPAGRGRPGRQRLHAGCATSSRRVGWGVRGHVAQWRPQTRGLLGCGGIELRPFPTHTCFRRLNVSRRISGVTWSPCTAARPIASASTSLLAFHTGRRQLARDAECVEHGRTCTGSVARRRTRKRARKSVGHSPRWLDDRPLDDASRAAYVGHFHQTGRARVTAAMAVAAVTRAARDAGESVPVGSLTLRHAVRLGRHRAVDPRQGGSYCDAYFRDSTLV